MEVRIWSAYNDDDRLVLVFSDEPGDFNFTRIPDGETDPVVCSYATLQCYLLEDEPELLNMVMRAKDLRDFMRRMWRKGYKVIEGRPQPMKFARL